VNLEDMIGVRGREWLQRLALHLGLAARVLAPDPPRSAHLDWVLSFGVLDRLDRLLLVNGVHDLGDDGQFHLVGPAATCMSPSSSLCGFSRAHRP